MAGQVLLGVTALHTPGVEEAHFKVTGIKPLAVVAGLVVEEMAAETGDVARQQEIEVLRPEPLILGAALVVLSNRALLEQVADQEL